MSASHRLAALAVAISALAPVTAHAMDDFIAASSSAPTAIKLCEVDTGSHSNQACADCVD